MDDRQANFLMREYESLRKEIEEDIREIRAIERYTVLGTFGIWTWLAASEKLPAVFRWGWWIPLALVVLAGVRALAIARIMELKGQYIRGLEEDLIIKGWEAYPPRRQGVLIKYSPLLFWFVMLLVAAIWPVVVWIRVP